VEFRRFRTTITVDIRPEVEAELIRQAAACGRAIEAHAATLLEDAVPCKRSQRWCARVRH
jgi:hypothetical protein